MFNSFLFLEKKLATNWIYRFTSYRWIGFSSFWILSWRRGGGGWPEQRPSRKKEKLYAPSRSTYSSFWLPLFFLFQHATLYSSNNNPPEESITIDFINSFEEHLEEGYKQGEYYVQVIKEENQDGKELLDLYCDCSSLSRVFSKEGYMLGKKLESWEKKGKKLKEFSKSIKKFHSLVEQQYEIAKKPLPSPEKNHEILKLEYEKVNLLTRIKKKKEEFHQLKEKEKNDLQDIGKKYDFFRKLVLGGLAWILFSLLIVILDLLGLLSSDSTKIKKKALLKKEIAKRIDFIFKEGFLRKICEDIGFDFQRIKKREEKRIQEIIIKETTKGKSFPEVIYLIQQFLLGAAT